MESVALEKWTARVKQHDRLAKGLDFFPSFVHHVGMQLRRALRLLLPGAVRDIVCKTLESLTTSALVLS